MGRKVTDPYGQTAGMLPEVGPDTSLAYEQMWKVSRDPRAADVVVRCYSGVTDATELMPDDENRSRVVSRLELAGVLVRTSPAGKGRDLKVELTDAGRLLAQVVLQERAVLQQALAIVQQAAKAKPARKAAKSKGGRV